MKNPSSISRVDFFRASSPMSTPISDSTHDIREINYIITRITLKNGIFGESYLLSFHYSPQAIAGALKDLAEMALGFNVNETGRFLDYCEKETEYFGHSGIHRWAMGSINIAMWDAWAKSLGTPVWKLFGTCRSRVPLYGSGGWLSYSIEELLEEVAHYIRRGFRAIKIKAGSSEPDRDIERLIRVRETAGPGIRIMIDANQGLKLDEALHLARKVKPLDISWFEEPLVHTDFDGYRQLRQQAGIPLAMGEREFDTLALRELISRQAIDLWQPDILRLGSVEAWRSSAALAHAYHIPVLPHYYKEYDVPLLMTIPNAFGAESFDWIDPLLTHPIRMKDGWAYPGDEPGWGFSFKEKFLSEL